MTTKITMIPYQRQGEIDYDSLCFDPYEIEVPEDHMIQNHIMLRTLPALEARVTERGRRSDVYFGNNTIICYDPANLNVHVAPDCYVAFGVDAQAVRDRLLYLPWEAGKPPDFALEIASSTTGQNDVRNKPRIYAGIGISEYWRFDSTGGEIYGEPLVGGILTGGVYRPVTLTTEPDGVLKGYSEALELSLCWHDNWLYFYDPQTHTYLREISQEQEARETAEAALAQERATREAAEAALAREQATRETAEARIRRLETELRRLRPEDA